MAQANEKLTTFPAFFKVDGRKVAVFGGGAEAFAKVRLLSNTSARIVVFATEVEDAFASFLDSGAADHVRAAFEPGQLEGSVLAFAATGDRELDARIVSDARARSIPVNAVDQIPLCDFYTPGIVNRAPVAIAIGTEGAGPVLGQIIRAKIDALLAPDLGALARLAASYRVAVDRMLPRGIARRDFWRRFFEGDVRQHLSSGDVSGARRAATRMLRAGEVTEGHVALVGAGPGAEDLLTLRAQRLLMEADVIVHDALVPRPVVDMGRRDAERIAAGKRKGCHSRSQAEINSLLVSLAQEGKRVVRLKAGDPMIFGRAAEEIEALRSAGIPFEIVPGVTAVSAAAADFALPVTLRGVSSSLVLTTGHDLKGDVLPDWASLAVSGATVAVYMGRSVAADVAGRLIEAGMAADTPVAIAENASRANKRLLHTTLARLPVLAGRDDLSGPVIVIIGDTVSAADLSRSEVLSEARNENTQPIIERIAS